MKQAQNWNSGIKYCAFNSVFGKAQIKSFSFLLVLKYMIIVIFGENQVSHKMKLSYQLMRPKL